MELFDRRSLLAILEQRTPPRSFLRNTFFGNIVVSETDTVQIDVIKHKRRLAPFVSPMMEGKVVNREGYSTHTYTPAYIKEKMPTKADDFLKRQAGETIYAPGDGPLQRAAKQLGTDLLTLEEMILRREEWMCAQLLNEGKVACVGEGIAHTIDFLMDTSHKITKITTGRWSETSTSNPYEDLRNWKRQIQRNSGLNPDVVILGQDVVEPFLKNDIIKQRMDLLRADFGRVAPTKLDNGVTWLAAFPELGLTLYSYDEWYLNDAGTLTPMMPVNKVWMGTTGARCSMQYGAIKDLKAMAAVARFAKSWETEDPSTRWVMLQSAPLPAMHQPDAFISAQVIDP